MSAEATRNPQIAEALRVSDEVTRDEIKHWLTRSRDQGGMGYDDTEAGHRALEIRFVVDGLALRAAREPKIDRAMLRSAVERLVRNALT
jgi:hypothetical protein